MRSAEMTAAMALRTFPTTSPAGSDQIAISDNPNDTANTRTQAKISFQIQSIDFKNLLIISSV
jgi:hypothetical protein